MVDIPAPKPAQVICYAYLWADEHEARQEEGRKDRPVAVILTVAGEAGSDRVAVLPITHTPPSGGVEAVEIPAVIKRHLGLDAQTSWIVLSESNIFTWPGPDLRSVDARSQRPTILYGYLPAGFFRSVRERFVAGARSKRVRVVSCSE